MKRSAVLQDLSREHHTALSLAQRITRADGDGTALREFGDALRIHVRFEERELFARAEALEDEGGD